MKTKEEIENLKDIRRNLWISVIGIIGGFSVLFLKTTTFELNWFTIPKILFIVFSIFPLAFFINEIICCNKSINKLINKLKEN